jgi:hypothetical protein
LALSTSPSRKLAKPKPTWLAQGVPVTPVVWGLKLKPRTPVLVHPRLSMCRYSPPNLKLCLPFTQLRLSLTMKTWPLYPLLRL